MTAPTATKRQPLLVTSKFSLLPPKPHQQCPVCGVMDFTEENMRDGWCPLCLRHTSRTPFTPDLDMTSEAGIEMFLYRLKEANSEDEAIRR